VARAEIMRVERRRGQQKNKGRGSEQSREGDGGKGKTQR
jgi:hypothetical protein